MPALMELATKVLGMTEASPAVRDYLMTGGANLDPATKAWCAAFVNSTLKQAGLPGTNSNMARSFLNYGQPVQQPQRGDIAVFSRGDPNGPFGHVGFFDGYDDKGNIKVLGGNQGNAVSIASYPAQQLLGFRRAGEGGAASQMAPQQQGAPNLGQMFAQMPEQPSMVDMIGEGVAGIQMPGAQQPRQNQKERARKEALFGKGGVADMFRVG